MTDPTVQYTVYCTELKLRRGEDLLLYSTVCILLTVLSVCYRTFQFKKSLILGAQKKARPVTLPQIRRKLVARFVLLLLLATRKSFSEKFIREFTTQNLKTY